MAHIIKQYLFATAALALCLLTGCEQPVETNKGDTPIAVTLSADSVFCNPDLDNQVALEITWTSGTNHGTGSAIAYTLSVIAEQSSDTLTWYIGRTMNRTITLTYQSLADTLVTHFPDMPVGEPWTFRVSAKATILMTGEQQVSEPACVVITRYASTRRTIYLVGDATPNGWDKDRATLMQQDYDNPNLFSWSGTLRAGEFKLLTTTADWLPCYVRNEQDESKMVYRENEDDYPDLKWLIASTGNYSIQCDVEKLTISITRKGGETYSAIYMIGDATPGGWSWDDITEMQHPEQDIFTYEGMLKRGEIKFPTELKSDWSGEMLFAPEPNCEPTENGTFDAHKGDPDNKWVIPAAGNWSIRIDIQNTTISFKQL